MVGSRCLFPFRHSTLHNIKLVPFSSPLLNTYIFIDLYSVCVADIDLPMALLYTLNMAARREYYPEDARISVFRRSSSRSLKGNVIPEAPLEGFNKWILLIK